MSGWARWHAGSVLAVLALSVAGLACRGGPGGPASSPELERRYDAFLAAPDANGAALAAIAMGETGDQRWVPYLVDLLRVVGDDNAATGVMVALQRLTGEYAVADVPLAYVTYGSWMLRERPDPGPDYSRWKRALYGRIDPSFDRLLAAVEDRHLLAELQWGGVVVGGIPAFDHPVRSAAAEAELTEDELVFGVVVGERAVAYPERILGYHELANDVIDGVAVVVTYCPLCRSARTFRSEGRTFATSGLLRGSNKVMVDHETGSLWQQLTGEALAGPEAGRTLEDVVTETTTWARWRRAHPATEVARVPAPGDERRGRYAYLPGDAYSAYRAEPDVWFPVLDPPAGLVPKAEVVGVVRTGGTMAWDTDNLARRGPAVVALGDEVLVAVATDGGGRVYDATGAALSPGAPLALHSADDDAAILVDGRVLPRVPSDRSLWFAWYGQHRHTGWWPR